MKNYKQFINEGVRDMMTPKSKESILKELEKLSDDDKVESIFFYDPEHKIFTEEDIEKLFMKLSPIAKINNGFEYDQDWLIELGIEETIEQDLDPEKVLDASFRHKYIKGIKAILDNYKLYGKDTKFIISCFMPDITNKEDIKYLMSEPQILKFLNPEQRYVIEKYRLGMHQNEVRDYEKRIIDLLDKLEIVQSKENPNITIGRLSDINKKLEWKDSIGVYFNYDKSTHKLTHHLDRMDAPLRKRPGDRHADSIHDFGARYDSMIMGGLIGKYLNVEIDKVDGSRNDGYSFKEK